MNDPQVWTVIGVFAAAVLGGMTLMTNQFSRVLRAELGGLRAEMHGELGGLRGEMQTEMSGVRMEVGGLKSELHGEVSGLRSELGALRSEMHVRLDTIDARLTRVEDKVDDLDKEVTNLATRFWRSQ